MALDKDSMSIGAASSNDVVIDDSAISRLHAVLEQYAAGWTLRDLGSRNGTFVNGERLIGATALRPGDQIKLGATEINYRGSDTVASRRTSPLITPPKVTQRERDVLRALCRPLLDGDLFREPATVHDIATTLTVSDDAVKKHLARLYDKFEIYEVEGHRRTLLANLAIATGAISIGELRM